jgi:hypothetical protein
MGMGAGLSTNAIRPQGYKPKSKCWGGMYLPSARAADSGNKCEAMRSGGESTKNGVSGMRLGRF